MADSRDPPDPESQQDLHRSSSENLPSRGDTFTNAQTSSQTLQDEVDSSVLPQEQTPSQQTSGRDGAIASHAPFPQGDSQPEIGGDQIDVNRLRTLQQPTILNSSQQPTQETRHLITRESQLSIQDRETNWRTSDSQQLMQQSDQNNNMHTEDSKELIQQSHDINGRTESSQGLIKQSQTTNQCTLDQQSQIHQQEEEDQCTDDLQTLEQQRSNEVRSHLTTDLQTSSPSLETRPRASRHSSTLMHPIQPTSPLLSPCPERNGPEPEGATQQNLIKRDLPRRAEAPCANTEQRSHQPEHTSEASNRQINYISSPSEQTSPRPTSNDDYQNKETPSREHDHCALFLDEGKKSDGPTDSCNSASQAKPAEIEENEVTGNNQHGFSTSAQNHPNSSEEASTNTNDRDDRISTTDVDAIQPNVSSPQTRQGSHNVDQTSCCCSPETGQRCQQAIISDLYYAYLVEVCLNETQYYQARIRRDLARNDAKNSRRQREGALLLPLLEETERRLLAMRATRLRHQRVRETHQSRGTGEDSTRAAKRKPGKRDAERGQRPVKMSKTAQKSDSKKLRGKTDSSKKHVSKPNAARIQEHYRQVQQWFRDNFRLQDSSPTANGQEPSPLATGRTRVQVTSPLATGQARVHGPSPLATDPTIIQQTSPLATGRTRVHGPFPLPTGHARVHRPSPLATAWTRLHGPSPLATGHARVHGPSPLATGQARVHGPSPLATGQARVHGPSPLATVQARVHGPSPLATGQARVHGPSPLDTVQARVHGPSPLATGQARVHGPSPLATGRTRVQVTFPLAIERTRVHGPSVSGQTEGQTVSQRQQQRTPHAETSNQSQKNEHSRHQYSTQSSLANPDSDTQSPSSEQQSTHQEGRHKYFKKISQNNPEQNHAETQHPSSQQSDRLSVQQQQQDQALFTSKLNQRSPSTDFDEPPPRSALGNEGKSPEAERSEQLAPLAQADHMTQPQGGSEQEQNVQRQEQSPPTAGWRLENSSAGDTQHRCHDTQTSRDFSRHNATTVEVERSSSPPTMRTTSQLVNNTAHRARSSVTTNTRTDMCPTQTSRPTPDTQTHVTYSHTQASIEEQHPILSSPQRTIKCRPNHHNDQTEGESRTDLETHNTAEEAVDSITSKKPSGNDPTTSDASRSRDFTRSEDSSAGSCHSEPGSSSVPIYISDSDSCEDIPQPRKFEDNQPVSPGTASMREEVAEVAANLTDSFDRDGNISDSSDDQSLNWENISILELMNIPDYVNQVDTSTHLSPGEAFGIYLPEPTSMPQSGIDSNLPPESTTISPGMTSNTWSISLSTASPPDGTSTDLVPVSTATSPSGTVSVFFEDGTAGSPSVTASMAPAGSSTQHSMPFPGSSTQCMPLPGSSTQRMPLPGSSTQCMPLPGSSTQCMPLPGSSTQHSMPFPGSSTQCMPLPGSSTQRMPLPGSSTQCMPLPGSSTQRMPLPGSSTQRMPLPGSSTQHSMPLPGGSTQHSMPLAGSSTQHNMLLANSSTQHCMPHPGSSTQHTMPFAGSSTQHCMPLASSSTPHRMPLASSRSQLTTANSGSRTYSSALPDHKSTSSSAPANEPIPHSSTMSGASHNQWQHVQPLHIETSNIDHDNSGALSSGGDSCALVIDEDKASDSPDGPYNSISEAIAIASTIDHEEVITDNSQHDYRFSTSTNAYPDSSEEVSTNNNGRVGPINTREGDTFQLLGTRYDPMVDSDAINAALALQALKKNSNRSVDSSVSSTTPHDNNEVSSSHRRAIGSISTNPDHNTREQMMATNNDTGNSDTAARGRIRSGIVVNLLDADSSGITSTVVNMDAEATSSDNDTQTPLVLSRPATNSINTGQGVTADATNNVQVRANGVTSGQNNGDLRNRPKDPGISCTTSATNSNKDSHTQINLGASTSAARATSPTNTKEVQRKKKPGASMCAPSATKIKKIQPTYNASTTATFSENMAGTSSSATRSVDPMGSASTNATFSANSMASASTNATLSASMFGASSSATLLANIMANASTNATYSANIVGASNSATLPENTMASASTNATANSKAGDSSNVMPPPNKKKGGPRRKKAGSSTTNTSRVTDNSVVSYSAAAQTAQIANPNFVFPPAGNVFGLNIGPAVDAPPALGGYNVNSQTNTVPAFAFQNIASPGYFPNPMVNPLGGIFNNSGTSSQNPLLLGQNLPHIPPFINYNPFMQPGLSNVLYNGNNFVVPQAAVGNFSTTDSTLGLPPRLNVGQATTGSGTVNLTTGQSTPGGNAAMMVSANTKAASTTEAISNSGNTGIMASDSTCTPPVIGQSTDGNSGTTARGSPNTFRTNEVSRVASGNMITDNASIVQATGQSSRGGSDMMESDNPNTFPTTGAIDAMRSTEGFTVKMESDDSSILHTTGQSTRGNAEMMDSDNPNVFPTTGAVDATSTEGFTVKMESQNTDILHTAGQSTRENASMVDSDNTNVLHTTGQSSEENIGTMTSDNSDTVHSSEVLSTNEDIGMVRNHKTKTFEDVRSGGNDAACDDKPKTLSTSENAGTTTRDNQTIARDISTDRNLSMTYGSDNIASITEGAGTGSINTGSAGMATSLNQTSVGIAEGTNTGSVIAAMPPNYNNRNSAANISGSSTSTKGYADLGANDKPTVINLADSTSASPVNAECENNNAATTTGGSPTSSARTGAWTNIAEDSSASPVNAMCDNNAADSAGGSPTSSARTRARISTAVINPAESTTAGSVNPDDAGNTIGSSSRHFVGGTVRNNPAVIHPTEGTSAGNVNADNAANATVSSTRRSVGMGATNIPVVLNPAALDPAALDPAALDPAHINPEVLNFAILNPNVLNPAVLSPTFMNFAGDSRLNPEPELDLVGRMNARVLRQSLERLGHPPSVYMRSYPELMDFVLSNLHPGVRDSILRTLVERANIYSIPDTSKDRGGGDRP